MRAFVCIFWHSGIDVKRWGMRMDVESHEDIWFNVDDNIGVLFLLLICVAREWLLVLKDDYADTLNTLHLSLNFNDEYQY